MWIKDYVKVALMNIQRWKISENALQWSHSAMFEIGLDGFGEVRTENTLCRLGDPPTCQTDIFSFAIHYSLNGQIEISGDKANATWYLFMPCTLGTNNQAMWRAGIDRETYNRIDGHWRYKHKVSEPLFNSPFDEGWAKSRFAWNGLEEMKKAVAWNRNSPC